MSDESLFTDALAIADPAARAAFLDGACRGDTELRRRIDALLAAHTGTNPLDRPPADLARTGAYLPGTEPGESTATVGDRVGPYKLLEKIGEGGMGEVWVADQLEPIKRRVALKLIKPGMDSRSVLGRFEAERQALAVMDHPNIAKVLDAGTTPDGRPYFVMELVKGTPITEFCDARRLTPKQRLELFVPVCLAIQHAHMKGIIHRDIKPGNVLVALHDETPVPKVIDFGVAKAVGQQLTEKTIYTGFGALVGTPAYMAPEQATFNQLDVDTRADVYALGVLLYELLAGSPPIEAERLKRSALDEILRIVRDEEPPRPSQRLSTSQAKANIAATRGSEPAKLSQLMKGELDWIVMKALEKDRTRRYDTANGLAADVRRYLAGDSVEACPPTLGYRLRKAYRKNRGAVLTAVAFTVLLLAGVVLSSYGFITARKASTHANWERENANDARHSEHEQWLLAYRARVQAEEQRTAAVALSERMRRNSYISDMGLAWNSDNTRTSRIQELLDRHRPTPGVTDLRGFEWHLIDNSLHHEQQTFTDRSCVRAVAFSPNGRLLASLSYSDNQRPRLKAELTVRDLATNRIVYVREVEGKTSFRLEFSPDGTLLVCTAVGREADNSMVGWYGEVTIWDAETGRVSASSVQYPKKGVYDPIFSPDSSKLAFNTVTDREASPTIELMILDLKTGTAIPQFTVKDDLDTPVLNPYYTVPGFTRDGRLYGVRGGDSVRLWDPKSGKDTPLFTTDGTMKDKVRPLIANRGTRLVAQSRSRIRVWDLEATPPKQLGNFQVEASWFGRIALSPDGQFLAATDPWTAIIRLWDVASGRLVRTFRHDDSVPALAFSSDGTMIATGSYDRSIKLWNFSPRPEVAPVQVDGWVLSAAHRPDGGVSVVLADTNLGVGPRRLRIEDAGSKKVLFDWPARSPDSKSNVVASLSPDGAFAVESGWEQQNRVNVWDVRRGVKVSSLPAEGIPGQRPSFLSNGLIATAHSDHAIEVWNVVSGKRLGRFVGHKAMTNGAKLSADGSRLFTYSEDETIRVWDMATGDAIHAEKVNAKWVFGTAVSPDGAFLARTDDSNGQVVIHDTRTWAEVRRLSGHPVSINSLAYSPDGRRLYTASMDRTVKVWDTEKGEELITLRHSGPIYHMALSPDGHRLAVFSATPNELRVWDATPRPEPKK